MNEKRIATLVVETIAFMAEQAGVSFEEMTAVIKADSNGSAAKRLREYCLIGKTELKG